jgi:hypothetical protein
MRKTWLPIVALSVSLVMAVSSTVLSQDTTEKRGVRGGRYPHLHAAERALRHAGNQLEKAAHHFGGHRAKALELVKQAEQELKQAVAWADAHPDEFKRGSPKQ